MNLSSKPILCLQEINCTMFNYLHPFISQNNYEIGFQYLILVYAPYADSKSDYMGIGIAFNTQEYKIKRTQIMKLADQKQWSFQQKPFYYKYLPYYFLNMIYKQNSYEAAQKRQNKVISIELESKLTQQKFCITNFHMPCVFYVKNSYFQDPQQMNIHTTLLGQVSNKFAENKPNILCGDFNFKPDSSSYQIITQGNLDQSHPESIKLPEQDKWNLKVNEFKSSYKEFHGQEPLMTNCSQMSYQKEKFEGCLDYIFYNGQLKVEFVAKAFEEKPVLLPDLKNPSDHLPLHAIFKII